MTDTEVVRPDAVYQGGRETQLPDWTSLDPCPSCGSRPHDAPEGTDPNGDPMWDAVHCWKCGFRPGVNTASDEAEMRRQFEQFKKFYNEQQDLKHPSLNAPADATQTGDQTGEQEPNPFTDPTGWQAWQDAKKQPGS